VSIGNNHNPGKVMASIYKTSGTNLTFVAADGVDQILVQKVYPPETN